MYGNKRNTEVSLKMIFFSFFNEWGINMNGDIVFYTGKSMTFPFYRLLRFSLYSQW